MKDNKNEILYSDPVNEIISNPPGRLVRWGTALIFTIFLLFILFAWLIRYPDKITGKVEITTINPPVTIPSKITGHIKKLYVHDSEFVSTGKLLAVMETTASISEFETLRNFTDSITVPEKLNPGSFPVLTKLGELQEYYSAFLKSLTDYNNYVKNDFYGSKISSLSEEISSLAEYINRMKAKEKLIAENLGIEKKKFERDSLLFSDSVLTESDFDRSLQAYNALNMELQQAGLDRSAKMIEMNEKRQLLQDYRITREDEQQKLAAILKEGYLNLKAQVRIWGNRYLIISPIDGIVTFTRFWSENQSVTADQPVLNVVPENPGDLVGRIYLNMERSGKVKVGKTVNIKLSGFPYLEYGMVRGVVKTKSLVPEGNAYVIEVALPDGLTTLYGKKLDFTQNMQGTAEILTDKLRLLQKLINPIRHLISINKA